MKIKRTKAELEYVPHALYRFFDEDDQLLYIGITANLTSRVENHDEQQPWWTAVVMITVEWFVGRSVVLEAEQFAIMTEGPLYNVQHVRPKDSQGRTCRCRSFDDCGSDRCVCWRTSKMGRSMACCARRQLRLRS